MIKLQLETAIFLYLLISIFGFLLLWVLSARLKLPSEGGMQLESIWQCSICTYFYVDSKHKKFSVCPRCQSYNEKKTGGAS